ncbi:MAG: segregation/condensation protein [Candidatus Doudnabacteria bacterium]|nr:segregation/condensation protein [Candidatus Doudnabacteria bacterium]
MQITITQFNGPLDLLLQLIEQQQMDITQISIAAVTEQFLQHIKTLEKVDPTSLADYLSVAAKLLVIKSKAILPTLQLDKEEEEIAVDLESKLLLYKKFKEASKLFKTLDSNRKQSFTREVSFEDKITFYPDPDVTTDKLRDSILNTLHSLEEINNLPKATVREAISIQDKIASLQQLLTEKIQTKMSDLIANAKDKTEVIVTFLALLELIKQRILIVDQEQIFSEIIIKKNESITE